MTDTREQDRQGTMAWVDRFVPGRILASAGLDLRRARMCVISSWMLAMGGLVWVAMRVGTGRPLLVAFGLGAAALAASVPVILRRTGSVQLAGHLITGLLCVAISTSNILTGGALLGMLLASLLVPPVAMALLDMRGGLLWGLAAVAQCVVAAGLVALGVEPLLSPPDTVRETMLLVGPATATALALAISAAFRRFEVAAVGELERARREAEIANAAKSRFLATMSHELRTPLNGVVGALSLLRGAGIDEAARGHVEIASQSAETLLALIGNILDLAAVEAGTLTIDARDFHFGDEIRGSVEALRAIASRKALELRVEIEPEVDAGVVGDRRRVRQLVTNLLGNALKYTEQGHVIVRVRLHSPGRVELAVEDTGPGISNRLRPQLFESYVRGSDAYGAGGTGLGLAIVREVVTRMGGSVRVETQVGRGSTFTIELPFVPSRSEELPPTASMIARARLRSILLVEDNDVNQLVIGALLESLGHAVTIAKDGQEGVERWSEGDYDCVLMDREMPRLDGLAAAEKIRALERERGGSSRTPIVALTASALQGDYEACLAAGMDDYLTKPVDTASLTATLNRLV